MISRSPTIVEKELLDSLKIRNFSDAVQPESSIDIETHHAFNLFDRNNDGIITTEDLKASFAFLGINNLTKNELNEFIEQIDETGKGYISYYDFEQRILAKKQALNESRENIIDTLRVFDFEDTGYMKANELRRIMLNLDDTLEVHIDEIINTFPAIDERINYHQFVDELLHFM